MIKKSTQNEIKLAKKSAQNEMFFLIARAFLPHLTPIK